MPTQPSKTPLAGGFLLMLCLIVGAIVGMVVGQPSIGILAGAGIGILVAVLIWAWDSRRRG
jgi:hypothetical protein